MLVAGFFGTVGLIALVAWTGPWDFLTVTLAAALVGILIAAARALRHGQRWHSIFLSAGWMAAFMILVLATDPLGTQTADSTRSAAATIQRLAGPQDRVLAYPHSPYSFVWHMWPRDVSVYDAGGRRVDQAVLADLLRECRQPRRTFCLLLSGADFDLLRQQSPAVPMTVLMEVSERRPVVEMFRRLLRLHEKSLKRSKQKVLIVVEPSAPA